MRGMCIQLEPRHQVAPAAPRCSRLVSNEALRFAYWLRAAKQMHVDPSDRRYHCPMCARPCCGWGIHLRQQCPTTVILVLLGFQAIAGCLTGMGRVIHWQNPLLFEAVCGASRQSWRLVNEDSDAASMVTSMVTVTWSGLILASRDLPTHVRISCTTAFLQLAVAASHFTSAVRWHPGNIHASLFGAWRAIPHSIPLSQYMAMNPYEKHCRLRWVQAQCKTDSFGRGM